MSLPPVYKPKLYSKEELFMKKLREKGL